MDDGYASNLRFQLKMFFMDLLELSYNDLRPGWGNPCSELLKKMCMYQEPFLDKIENDYTDHSHEFRLNGAGLKMYWIMRMGDDRVRRFKCSIGGDQAKEYPFFVAQANDLFKKYNFNKR